MIDIITNPKTVTFSQQIDDIPLKPHNSSDHKAKPIIKQHLHDHPSSVTPSQDHLLAPFQDHKQSIPPFQDHKAQIVPPSQDNLTTADVRDITALKCIPNQFWNHKKYSRRVYHTCGPLSTPSTACTWESTNRSLKRNFKCPPKYCRQRNYNTCN